MKKWYDEEYEFQIEVIGFLNGDRIRTVLSEWGRNRRQIHLYLWLPRK